MPFFSQTVKKPFANQPQTAERDGETVRDLEPVGAPGEAMMQIISQSEHAAGHRHDEQQQQHGLEGQPQSERADQLDVAAAHRADGEGDGEQGEDERGDADLGGDVGPEREADRPPEGDGEQGDGEIEEVGNGPLAHVEPAGDEQEQRQQGE